MTPGTPAAQGFILLQRLLPQFTLSRLIHALARVRVRAVKNALISAFVRVFKPQMSDARQPDPLAYESFNAFFTRELAAGTRKYAMAVLIVQRTAVRPLGALVAQHVVLRRRQ